MSIATANRINRLEARVVRLETIINLMEAISTQPVAAPEPAAAPAPRVPMVVARGQKRELEPLPPGHKRGRWGHPVPIEPGPEAA